MELIERVIIISLIIFKWKKEKERRENCILYFPLTFTGKRKKLSYSRKIYSYPIRELANSCTPFKSFPKHDSESWTKLKWQKKFFSTRFRAHQNHLPAKYKITYTRFRFQILFIRVRNSLNGVVSSEMEGQPGENQPGTINVIVNNYDARRGVNGGLFESCNGILDCFKSFLVGEVDFERIMLLFGE